MNHPNGDIPSKAPENAPQVRIEPFEPDRKPGRKPTCSDLIMQVLAARNIGVFLAIHEIAANIRGLGYCHSETAISARLRELCREGKVEGCSKKGKSFKLWGLSHPKPEEPRPANWGDTRVKQEGFLL